MAQPSIASYFATRKRSAVDEANIVRAKKVLILDSADDNTTKGACYQEKVSACEVIYSKSKELFLNNNEVVKPTSERHIKFPQRNKVVAKLNFDLPKSATTNMVTKKAATLKARQKKITNQPDIQKVFLNLNNKSTEDSKEIFTQKQNIQQQKKNEVTPPASPVKNAMDTVKLNNKELSLNEIKHKLSRSSRLAELKASISKFNKSADKLKEIEKKTTVTQPSPSLKSFTSIEVEVLLSPKKAVSPVKPYLSPRKDVPSPRKNLFGLSSPSKSPLTSPLKIPAYQRFQTLVSSEKSTLTLPYNYRSLAELFRSIDTVCSMLYNRKETITFSKLKPAVQEMTRRNLTEQHFAQIKAVYPDAFTYNWEKMKMFASMSRQEKYELVITPLINNESQEYMNPTCLLERKRKLFNALIEKVKDCHDEFLQSLDPPMVISREKVIRWHPEFDIEKIPDISPADFPKQPEEEKLSTGQEVLEKARNMFNCNTRMEKALQKLKEVQEGKSKAEEVPKVVATQTPVTSALKGIPKSLLEKVRAKQAAKALDAMTRSATQDQDALMYSRLPDIARLMRNIYVAEKKGVLPLEDVIIKLNHSYRSYLKNSEIEDHLRLLSKVVPGWIVFHEIRGTLFVKLSRDGDMNKVLTKLEDLAKHKSNS